MLFPYCTSNGEIQPFEVPEMTIGIGVLCDGGDTVILASDMRITYNDTAAPSDRGGKQYDFPPFTLAAAIAGNTSVNAGVASEIAHQLTALLAYKHQHPEQSIVARHIHRVLNIARRKQLRAAQECAMLADLGISLNDWLSGKLPDANHLDDLALRYGLQVLSRVRNEMTQKLGIILAGFMENGLVFLRAVGAKPMEEAALPPNYVIGTGSRAALDVLSRREQGTDCTLARSLLHVYEALRAARASARKTVGPPAAYLVMRSEKNPELPGLTRFPAESALLRGWHKAYKNRGNTKSLDSPVANHQAKCLLRRHQSRASMVLTHETFNIRPIQAPKFE